MTTNQTFFATAYAHAQTMPGPAAYLQNEIATCVFRTPDGDNRCLVGINIPDDLYQPRFDISSSLENVLAQTGNGGVDLQFARAVQSAHDRNATEVLNGDLSVEAWRTTMLSDLRNLKVPQS